MHLIILFVIVGGIFSPIATPSTSIVPSTPVINGCDWELDTDYVVREYCNIPSQSARDCSPEIDYKTEAEELAFCKLKDQNPNCLIYEDFSIKCK